MAATMTVTVGALTLTDDPGSDDPGWKLMDLDGWWSAPPTETDSDPIPLADGNFEGQTRRRAKKVSLNGVVTASTPLLARQAAWRAVTGLSPTGGAMTLAVTDELGTLTQRVRLDSAPQVIPYGTRRAFFRIPLVAADPRKYGPVRTGTAKVAGSGTSTDGLAFPLFTDGTLSFGAFNTSGLAGVTNTGTAPTWATLAVKGAFDSGLSITGNDGTRLVYSAPIPSGSTLLMSPYAGGRATMDGADVSVNLTTSLWRPVMPGASVSYALAAIGTSDAGAGLTISYSEAWW